MKIELKRLTTNARLSEETHCFAADLWVDGKKIGEVSNEGHGGCDRFHGDQRAYDAANAWCKANLPRWSMRDVLEPAMAQQLEDAGNRPETHETDLEMHIAELVNQAVALKAMRRALGRKVLFTKVGKGGVWEISPPNGKTVAEAAQKIATLEGTAKVLNLLPEDEALALYRAA